MYDFSLVQKAKQNTQEKYYDKNKEKFNEVYNEALAALEDFSLCPCFDFDNLSDAMNLFAEAIELKKNRPEPYYYLSYIFFLLKDTAQAVNYLLVVNNLNPNMPGLHELRENINSQISIGMSDDTPENEENDDSPEEEIITFTEPEEELQKNKLLPKPPVYQANVQISHIKNTVNNYNANQIKAYSSSFKDKVYKMGLKF